MNSNHHLALFPLAMIGVCACTALEATTPIAETPGVTVTLTAHPTQTAAPEETATPAATLPPTPLADFENLGEQALAMLPEYAQDVARLAEATRYWIEVEVTFDPVAQEAMLDGVARIRFVNPLEGSLPDLVLMLWPNDRQYRSTMEAGAALIDGVLLEPRLELDGLALRYELPRPLATGEAIDISLPFQLEATGPIGGGIPRRFGVTEGVLFAPTFYPLVPRLSDGDWQVEGAPPGGDTTNSDVAFYHVELTVPEGFALVASGVEVERRVVGEDVSKVTYVSGPVRDFAFALGPFETDSRAVGEVEVRGWVLPEHAEAMKPMLEAASTQVALLGELVGPYPYVELDLVDLPGAFGGIEYPGVVTVGTLGSFSLVEPTVHEVTHQWFYGLIGGDQLHEPWLDEAAATYGEVLYYEAKEGVGSATGYLSEFRRLIRLHPDPTRPIGMEVAEYSSTSEYGLIVYFKGALFFDALRAEMGDEVFFAFLKDYFATYRYGYATAVGFQAVAEATCSCDLDPLFDLWVFEGGEIPGL